jgi:hypothetical protein
MPSLGVSAEQLQAASQAEECKVIGGCPHGDRLELGCRFLVTLGVKQRPPERLADRGLLGSQVASSRQGDHRLVVMARLE